MNPKLVLLRGKPTAGKSTAFHNLKNNEIMKDWIFLDFPKIKEIFEFHKDSNKLSKSSLFEILKYLMKEKRNIILEEMSEETLRKYIESCINNNNYEIVTFQFGVSKKTAYERDRFRAKNNIKPLLGKKLIDELDKMHEDTFDKKGILIDSEKLDEKQVVEIILKRIL